MKAVNMDVINNFWLNAEREAIARGLDIKELALAAGAQPGERVLIEQADEIKKRLSAAGPVVTLEDLIKQ
jgi:ribosomal protein L7/L12